ncbi:hypothetical protein P692DRAFT_20866978 [Suillus brevipes Sb2]|nr:hypothetical protein P692DRAFT_20866978 [Suillus brevipes Sb2]
MASCALVWGSFLLFPSAHVIVVFFSGVILGFCQLATAIKLATSLSTAVYFSKVTLGFYQLATASKLATSLSTAVHFSKVILGFCQLAQTASKVATRPSLPTTTSTTSAVTVTNISSSTAQEKLHEFFSFCGDIKSIDLNPEGASKQLAIVTFEEPSSASTALVLNGGTLDGERLHIASDVERYNHHEQSHQSNSSFEQPDKPRAEIAAKYLAKGYKLSDHILQRAIEINNKQGISKQFLDYMHTLDTTVGQKALGPDQTMSGKVQSTLKDAHTRAKTIDEQKGYSKVAHEYYSKAISSPFGKFVFDFYTTTSRQVRDIHEEACRMVDHQPAASLSAGSSTHATGTGAAGPDAQPSSAAQASPTVVWGLS